MDEATRYTLVYAIVGTLLLIGVPALIAMKFLSREAMTHASGLL